MFRLPKTAYILGCGGILIDGLSFFWIGISGVYCWGLYQIGKILHYESHKYEKVYIEQKYNEYLYRYIKLQQQAKQNIYYHVQFMNLFIIRLKQYTDLWIKNESWHDRIYQCICKFQRKYAGWFAHQHITDLTRQKRFLRNYAHFLGSHLLELELRSQSP